MIKINLLQGDCLNSMKELPDNSIDWKPVKGFEHYLISSDGRVFNTRRNQIKKSGLDHKGYQRVRLINGAVGSTKKVHRLVAEAFLQNFSKDLQVNHINCIKDDNRVENLEMVNQSQNTSHAWKNKRMKLTVRGIDGKFVATR